MTPFILTTLGKGDALVFLSHKAHCVQPVTHGLRQTLVMELWEGEERQEVVVGIVIAAHTDSYPCTGA